MSAAVTGTANDFKVVATTEFKGTVVEVLQGDLLEYPVDVIVNAANAELDGGEGVSGAIQIVAGPEYLAEMGTRFPHPGKVGGAYGTTSSYGLTTCRYIIHAVGPDWRIPSQRDPHLLRSAYLNSLNLAARNHLTSISFPAISVGIFAMPHERAGPEVMNAIRDWLLAHQHTLDRISILLLGLERQTIDKMQYPNLQTVMPNEGTFTINDPPAAFRAAPVSRPPPSQQDIQDLIDEEGSALGTPDSPIDTEESPAPPPPGTSGVTYPTLPVSTQAGTSASPPTTKTSTTGIQPPPRGPERSQPGPPPPELPEHTPTPTPTLSPSPSTPRTPPDSPPWTPPTPPPRPEGGRPLTPSSDSGDSTPPYLFNFYQPLSRMWMGRDRYYAMLQAGLDPESYTEGMEIPNPEADPDVDSLPDEERVLYDDYHRERIERGEDITRYLRPASRVTKPTAARKATKDRAAELDEQKEKWLAQSVGVGVAAPAAAGGGEQAAKVRCAAADPRGRRCAVMCNQRAGRGQLNYCFLHRRERWTAGKEVAMEEYVSNLQ